MPRPIRVLIIDDSPLVCDLLSKGLAQDPGIEVVGTALDPFEAWEKIDRCQPEVLTLDVEMPRMNGVEFLLKMMPRHPLPTVMVSAWTEKSQTITLDALAAGAVDFVAKPTAGEAHGLAAMMMELRTKIIIASMAKVARWKREPANKVIPPTGQVTDAAEKVVVIGASTGGVEAIHEIVKDLPGSMPGIVIVQHMPAGFTRLFAERLNAITDLEVKEAEPEDRIRPGRIFIAPGGKHTSLVRKSGEYGLQVQDGALVNGHCPSVEVLMLSAAECAGPRAVGVMLTGMGRDGASAMKRMRERGARCIAQDQETSVVFGMPKAAFDEGGAEKMVPLRDMARTLVALVTGLSPRTGHGA